MNSDQKQKKLGQSDLVYVDLQVIAYLCCQLSFTDHGLFVSFSFVILLFILMSC